MCVSFFFFNDTATTEIYTILFVGSVRCVIRDSVELEVLSKSGQLPHAKLTIRYQDQNHEAEASGDGAVDAIFNAIEKLIKSGTELQLYSVNAVTQGTDSQGGVTVRLEKDGRIINGQGADTDILVASAKAYLHALTLMRNPGRLHPQLGGV